MTVTLRRAYGGYASGAIVQFDKSTEASMIAQALATDGGTITSGAATANQLSGRASITAATSSVVITNNLVNANSKLQAWVAQGTADATLTDILRIVPAAGSFTLFGNANATAATLVDWRLLNPLT